MRPNDLVLRCYAEKVDGQWQAFCIDLNLAAQGDSLEDVSERLERMVGSYLYDVFEGDDREHAEDLFPRRAPIGFIARYYVVKARNALRRKFAPSARPRVALAFKKFAPAHFSPA